jgi:hypothetical protein
VVGRPRGLPEVRGPAFYNWIIAGPANCLFRGHTATRRARPSAPAGATQASAGLPKHRYGTPCHHQGPPCPQEESLCHQDVSFFHQQRPACDQHGAPYLQHEYRHHAAGASYQQNKPLCHHKVGAALMYNNKGLPIVSSRIPASRRGTILTGSHTVTSRGTMDYFEGILIIEWDTSCRGLCNKEGHSIKRKGRTEHSIISMWSSCT